MQNHESYYCAELLLVSFSDEKVPVLYDSNPQPFLLPKIGPRPPYYCNPHCEPYYPII
ncbi:hypothetical protein Curi_c17980 [Gottschalkia acidurici 9a]|uniref:Uncharacterized protein n=1 Tax=Gottschalkia acidurici (strain ATCC 7906 / DSM 604 / BCRC 14475 / CIP 104303 / KCTC 5404 / NCIMB 10678 / 9a) TaxID=1128398 RepID=K0B1G7_GOTA9|nr:hypothetical protein [Gottschalkia acidurici]AFS78805.1 hypothetical protein Curi_c17980 [Gottschalkia acidurici 9a]